MIQEIYTAALEPFTTNIGWQAFAYGATGRVILTYAKNFIEAWNGKADEAVDEAEVDLDEDTE